MNSTRAGEKSTGTRRLFSFSRPFSTTSRHSATSSSDATPPEYVPDLTVRDVFTPFAHAEYTQPEATTTAHHSNAGADADVVSPPEGGGALHFEHSFVIERVKPWATLHTFTQRPPPSALMEDPGKKPQLPVIWGGTNLAGLVELYIDGSQTIQKIMVSLGGKVLSGYVDSEIKLMDYNIVLWDKSMGDPRPSLTQGSSKKFDGKFAGTYHFPFNIPWPTTIDLLAPSKLAEGQVSSFPAPENSPSNTAVGKRQQTRAKEGNGEAPNSIYPPPQTFTELSRVPGNVRYELALTMVHGRFKIDSEIRTNVVYIPSTVPPPPSAIQQEAYSAHQRAPGPLTDPDGWVSLPQSTMKGELKGIGGRRVEIASTLYLAKPTSYTRGTLIPCFMTLSSQDSNALDALCSPKTPQVRLIRRIRHFTPHGGPVEVRPTREPPMPLNVNLKRLAHEIGVATWRVPSQDVVQETSVRHLEGEIRLAIDLEPTSTCPVFAIEYLVELLPLASPIFDPAVDGGAIIADAKKQVLASCVVEITTLHSPELHLPAALLKENSAVSKSYNIWRNVMFGGNSGSGVTRAL